MTRREQKWNESYKRLNAYIQEYRQLLAKSNLEDKWMLNWWKYNKKLIKNGTLSEEGQELLRELSLMRNVHRGK